MPAKRRAAVAKPMSGTTKRRIKSQFAVLLVGFAAALWAVLLLQKANDPTAAHLHAGMEAARQGNAPAAEREWQAVLQRDPKNKDALLLLGELAMQTEQWEKGKDIFTRLLQAAPETPHVYARLAACTLRTSDEIQARDYALKEIERDPNEPGSLMILAFFSAMQNDQEQEILYLQRLRKTTPDDVDMLEMLAKVLLSQNRYDELRPIVDRLIAVAPDNAIGYAMRGVLISETDASPDGLQKAEADLLKALQCDPLYVYVRFNLGRVYAKQRKYKEAIRQLELSERSNPYVMDVPFELATAYQRMGQKDKADAARKRFQALRATASRLSVMQKQCANDPKNFVLHLQVGEYYLKREDFRLAMTYLGKALQLRPDDPKAVNAYAQLQAKLQGADPRDVVWKKTQPPAPAGKP